MIKSKWEEESLLHASLHDWPSIWRRLESTSIMMTLVWLNFWIFKQKIQNFLKVFGNTFCHNVNFARVTVLQHWFAKKGEHLHKVQHNLFFRPVLFLLFSFVFAVKLISTFVQQCTAVSALCSTNSIWQSIGRETRSLVEIVDFAFTLAFVSPAPPLLALKEDQLQWTSSSVFPCTKSEATKWMNQPGESKCIKVNATYQAPHFAPLLFVIFTFCYYFTCTGFDHWDTTTKRPHWWCWLANGLFGQ